MLAKISSTLLGLVELVIGGLDAIVLITVFPSFHGVEVLGPGNFFLVTSPLLLELVEFVTGVVDFLAEGMATVGLLGAVTLCGEDLSLTTGDLFTSRGNLGLQVVIRSVLFIEQETGVINFLLQAGESETVRVMASLEVVVLEQFLVLQVSVLCLQSVELVTEGQVVLVSLFNLKDLSFQLRNQQVFLVAGQVHAIVVLQKITVKNSC